ncbi:MAG: cyclase family protein [Saprospiraceae bacterium]|nr:cyclase family protein [Saprospiraceae bacterium]
MKYIDLTLSYDEKIAGFSSDIARTVEKDGWNARNLHIYSHAGTHMDAPVHFGVSDATIDQFSPEDFFSKRAWIVDLTGLGASHLIVLTDVLPQIPKFKKGDSLLLKTNWYQKLGTTDYRNALPRIGEDLAHWMVENQVKMVGVEPPSVADVNNLEEVTLIHKILLGSVIIVEGLCNLDKIKAKCVELIALPLKIKDGDGAPCRVVAIEH